MSHTKERTIIWQGQSGKSYEYWIYKLPPNFSSKPGNYVFARETSPGRFVPVYIGETSDLSERFDNHHKAACISRNGATHIHAHVNSDGAAARLAEEADLVARWQPRCNG
jgi:hypothetical protein